MKRGKRVKPVFPIEYRLLIQNLYDESKKQKITSFNLRTISEFSNFSYEIVVDAELQERTIYFNIKGIRAPKLSIPSSGPAFFNIKYPNLNGRYKLIVSKPQKSSNEFLINIAKKKIIIEKLPEEKFIDITSSEDEF